MTDEQKKKCHMIIHGASATAAGIGAGLAQIPGSDNVVLVGIQTTMIIGLGKVFGMQLTETAAQGLIGTGISAVLGPVVARTVTGFLIGWIPGIGNAINASTAAGITEALGWYFAKEFHSQYSEKKNEIVKRRRQ